MIEDNGYPMNLKKLFTLAKELFFIKTRAIEHLFVGGCLYCAIRQVLLVNYSSFLNLNVCVAEKSVGNK